MKNIEQLSVLKAFNLYLPIVSVYNSENFTRIDCDRILQNIGLVFGVTIIEGIFPILNIALAIWGIFDNGGALDIAVAVIPLILTTFQLFITFFILVWKNRLISETIHQIQNVLNESRCYSHFDFHGILHFFLLQAISQWNTFSIGCKNSSSSHQNYEQVEQKYTLVASYLAKVTCALVIAATFGSILCPISYFIFDYPPPQSWVLPAQIQ